MRSPTRRCAVASAGELRLGRQQRVHCLEVRHRRTLCCDVEAGEAATGVVLEPPGTASRGRRAETVVVSVLLMSDRRRAATARGSVAEPDIYEPCVAVGRAHGEPKMVPVRAARLRDAARAAHRPDGASRRPRATPAGQRRRRSGGSSTHRGRRRCGGWSDGSIPGGLRARCRSSRTGHAPRACAAGREGRPRRSHPARGRGQLR